MELQRARKEEEEEEKFLFVLLVMKQVDPSTTYYRSNACNPLIKISFSFFLAFIRLDIDVSVSMHRSSDIHYRSRKKIIDSKQLCSMCVHIERSPCLKNTFLSIIINSQCTNRVIDGLVFSEE